MILILSSPDLAFIDQFDVTIINFTNISGFPFSIYLYPKIAKDIALVQAPASYNIQSKKNIMDPNLNSLSESKHENMMQLLK